MFEQFYVQNKIAKIPLKSFYIFKYFSLMCNIKLLKLFKVRHTSISINQATLLKLVKANTSIHTSI